jgi:hypothetical protein
LNKKLGRENISKPTIGNGELQDSNDNGVIMVKYST